MTDAQRIGQLERDLMLEQEYSILQEEYLRSEREAHGQTLNEVLRLEKVVENQRGKLFRARTELGKILDGG